MTHKDYEQRFLVVGIAAVAVLVGFFDRWLVAFGAALLESMKGFW